MECALLPSPMDTSIEVEMTSTVVELQTELVMKAGEVTLCFASVDVKTQFLNSDSKRINVTSVSVHGIFDGSLQPETKL